MGGITSKNKKDYEEEEEDSDLEFETYISKESQQNGGPKVRTVKVPDHVALHILPLHIPRPIRASTDSVGAHSGVVIAVDAIEERAHWAKELEFILSCIGYTVGLGNVWRFPFYCYKSGGGAFLIPYFIMLFLCGFPLLYMELAVGQYTRLGPIGALEKMCPFFKGAGLATVVISFLLCTYYNVIISWALFYLFNSFRSELPWASCNNTWNSYKCWVEPGNSTFLSVKPNDTVAASQEFYDNKVLQMSTGLHEFGNIRWELALLLLLSWILVYFSIWKSVRSSGKVVYFTATFPYVLLVALLVRGVTLEGAELGLHYLLYPKWEQLLEAKVWVNAAAQNFNSIGVAFGSLIAMSSYNKFNNNILKDTLIVLFVDACTSILAGLAIFSILGHIATIHNTSVNDVVTQGPGLVFVVYPEAFKRMPVSQLWAVLFFFMLLCLGLDSQFAMVEVIITSLQDAYSTYIKKYLKHHEVLVLIVCCISFCCGLPNVTQGGIFFFTLIDYYAAGMSLMYLAFFEVVAITWCYGANRLARNVLEMTGRLPFFFFRFCWLVAAPILILSVWIFSLVDYRKVTYDENPYPDWAEVLGWFIALLSILCIPLGAISAVIKSPGTSILEKFRNSFKSTLPEVHPLAMQAIDCQNGTGEETNV